MPDTAIYDLISHNNNAMLRQNMRYRKEQILRKRQENSENQIPKLGALIGAKEIPYEDFDSGSDSENGIYESLVEITLRKSIENANRRAKISRVQKTGHPLFDHLREERALKENISRKKKPSTAKPVSKPEPVEDEDTYLPANNSFLHRKERTLRKNSTIEPPATRKSLSSSHLNNSNQVRYSKGIPHSMSLQQMSSAYKRAPVRKISEAPSAQSLPRKLHQTREMAKSEQNLFYMRSEVPSFHGYPHHMNQMFEFQAGRPDGRGFQRKHTTDSSDSDSDNWIIPRPKFGNKKPNQNRGDFEFYGRSKR